MTFEAARADFERRFVTAALARAGGRRAGAARLLGVSRQGLAKMLRRLRIEDAAIGA
jgi:transcriptional regulator with GAF, ATPase, and Fis domain